MQQDDNLRERLRAGEIERRVSFVGLVVLCISFFLPSPAIYAPRSDPQENAICYSVASPSQRRPGMSPAAAAFLEGHAVRYFTSAGLPFVFGYVGACLYIFLRYTQNEKRYQFLLVARTSLCVAFLLAGAAVMCRGLVAIAGWLSVMAHMYGATDYQDPLSELVPSGVLTGIIAMVFVMALGCGAILFTRRGARGPLGMFFCGLVFLPFFAVYLFDDFRLPHFGPLVSVAACLLIGAGGLWEAITVRRTGRAPR